MVVSKRLEIITPIRGRKQFSSRMERDYQKEFRNNNPDKGTETEHDMADVLGNVFRNNNPDKGTETG